MTLNEAKFLGKISITNEKGKIMKKNRKYYINGFVYKNPCIKNIHLERILEVIEARFKFKKRILDSAKRILEAVRRAKLVARTRKIENQRKDYFEKGIEAEIVAFFCRVPMDKSGAIAASPVFSITISEHRQATQVVSKALHHSHLMLKTDLLKLVYPSSKKKRGRKPYKFRLEKQESDDSEIPE